MNSRKNMQEKDYPSFISKERKLPSILICLFVASLFINVCFFIITLKANIDFRYLADESSKLSEKGQQLRDRIDELEEEIAKIEKL